MTIRIPEPTGAQMRYLSKDQKELLMAQRNVEYGRKTGNPATYDLITLGLFDEAGTEEAAQIKAAIELDDNDFCSCVAEIGKEYQTIRKVWSEKHGGMVPVLRCHLCGHMNATPEIPSERHAKIDGLRADGGNVPDRHHTVVS